MIFGCRVDWHRGDSWGIFFDTVKKKRGAAWDGETPTMSIRHFS
jgi:hypothetical protein